MILTGLLEVECASLSWYLVGSLSGDLYVCESVPFDGVHFASFRGLLLLAKPVEIVLTLLDVQLGVLGLADGDQP